LEKKPVFRSFLGMSRRFGSYCPVYPASSSGGGGSASLSEPESDEGEFELDKSLDPRNREVWMPAYRSFGQCGPWRRHYTKCIDYGAVKVAVLGGGNGSNGGNGDDAELRPTWSASELTDCGYRRTVDLDLDMTLLLPVLRGFIVARCVGEDISAGDALRNSLDWVTDDESGNWLSELPWFADHFPQEVPMGCAVATLALLAKLGA
jgi:hypothetical protein